MLPILATPLARVMRLQVDFIPREPRHTASLAIKWRASHLLRAQAHLLLWVRWVFSCRKWMSHRPASVRLRGLADTLKTQRRITLKSPPMEQQDSCYLGRALCADSVPSKPLSALPYFLPTPCHCQANRSDYSQAPQDSRHRPSPRGGQHRRPLRCRAEGGVPRAVLVSRGPLTCRLWRGGNEPTANRAAITRRCVPWWWTMCAVYD